VASLYPRTLGSLFVVSCDPQGLRWRYSNQPPHGSLKTTEREREREREIEFGGGGSERHNRIIGGIGNGQDVWKVPRHSPLVLLIGWDSIRV
jgi:hypothetical protein